MPSPAVAPSIPAERDFTALPLRRRVGWIVLLGALNAIGAFTIDLYLPAFPALEADLGASASRVQLTLTGTMAGLAVGQLVAGPLTDALGRRRPLLVGLGLHLVASLLCTVAPSVGVLGLLRVLQGLGMAAASVIALAVVRDRFEGRGAARLIARLMLVIGAAPVFAPSVGSLLLGVTSWRGIFAVLAVLALVLGIAVAFALPETLPVERRRRASLRGSAAAYAALLHDRGLVALVVVAGLTMAALFGYVAGSSFVFQEQYGFTQLQFALAFAGGGVAIVAGSQTNGSLVHRFSSQGLLVFALVAGTLTSASLLVATTTGLLGLGGVLVPLYGTMFFIGLAQPNAPVLVLERHGASAGTAAAVLGFSQFLIGSLAAPVSSLLGLSPAVGIGVVMTTGMGAALVLFLTVARPALRTPPPAPPSAQATGDLDLREQPAGAPVLTEQPHLVSD